MTTQLEERNKALVLEAFDTLFNKRDYDAAARFWSLNYIQHSAHIAPGRQGLFDLIRSLPPTLKYESGKQPTLVVNGNNDVIVPTINSYHLQQNLPNAELILYPDSNHGSQYQYPELFVDQLNQFLSWGLPKPNGSQARLRFPSLLPGAGVDE